MCTSNEKEQLCSCMCVCHAYVCVCGNVGMCMCIYVCLCIFLLYFMYMHKCMLTMAVHNCNTQCINTWAVCKYVSSVNAVLSSAILGQNIVFLNFHEFIYFN